MRRNQFIVRLPQPVAGADFSYTAANAESVYLQSITAVLTTSAAVASRQVALRAVDDQGNLLTIDMSAATQAASLAYTYNWKPASGNTTAPTAGAVVGVSGPDFWLPAPCTISSLTASIQAADQWSAIVFTYLVSDRIREVQMAQDALEFVEGI